MEKSQLSLTWLAHFKSLWQQAVPLLPQFQILSSKSVATWHFRCLCCHALSHLTTRPLFSGYHHLVWSTQDAFSSSKEHLWLSHRNSFLGEISIIPLCMKLPFCPWEQLGRPSLGRLSCRSVLSQRCLVRLVHASCFWQWKSPLMPPNMVVFNCLATAGSSFVNTTKQMLSLGKTCP